MAEHELGLPFPRLNIGLIVLLQCLAAPPPEVRDCFQRVAIDELLQRNFTIALDEEVHAVQRGNLLWEIGGGVASHDRYDLWVHFLHHATDLEPSSEVRKPLHA